MRNFPMTRYFKTKTQGIKDKNNHNELQIYFELNNKNATYKLWHVTKTIIKGKYTGLKYVPKKKG